MKASRQSDEMEEALRGAQEAAGPGAGAQALEDWICVQYEEHGPGLRRYLSRMVGDAALAEDLTQEVFVRLLETLREKQPVRRLRPWVFQVGHNLAIDHLRRSGMEEWPRAGRLLDGERDAAPSAETLLLEGERRKQVSRGLFLLSDQERQALELRAEGLKYREIAELMGVQMSTVTTFLSRAVNKISRQIHG